MQYTVVSLLSLLTASAFAAPSTYPPPAPRDTPVTFATVALSNDQSGAYGTAQIPINGVTILINSAFANTGVAQGGSYTASSASLVGGLANNPLCTILNTAGGSAIGQLNNQKTYLKFGNPNMLETTSLSSGAIICVTA